MTEKKDLLNNLKIDRNAKAEPSEIPYKNILIAGGGDSALDWTVNLHPLAKKLTLLHRRDDFRAAPDTINKMRKLVADGEMQLEIAQLKELRSENGVLKSVAVKGETGEYDIECDMLLAFYGLTMKLGPVANFGINLDRNLIPVDTEKFETDVAGIFAVSYTHLRAHETDS